MEKQMHSAALHVRNIPAGGTLSQAALCNRIVITDARILGT